MTWHFWIDRGGTFTDVVARDPAGHIVTAKLLSEDPERYDDAAVAAIRRLTGCLTGLLPPLEVRIGTTVATNALLERKGEPTLLAITHGFGDALTIGHQERPELFARAIRRAPPVHDRTVEIEERVSAEGEILRPLDLEAARTAFRQAYEDGYRAIAIVLMHGYRYPAHEAALAELARDIGFEQVSASHAVAPLIKLIARGDTSVVDAYLSPVLKRYVDGVRRALGDGPVPLFMQSNGGLIEGDAFHGKDAILSGPAGGIVGMARTAQAAGFDHVIGFDMGGTSTDVALIRDAEPTVSNEIEVEYAMPIHVPMVDVRTVGAGGGSIARITAAGLLQVGPESAGATPGPICYGRGGMKPTISDANLLLGRLNPGRLNSVPGGMTIDHIKAIFQAELGHRLGLDAVEAADAVVRVANARMSDAVRMVSVSLGEDPRDFALFAFGGAGPLHATAIARELGIPKVLAPSRPGITNALGCVVADLRHDFVQTVNRPLANADMEAVHAIFARQSADGRELIGKEAVTIREIREIRTVDMQFIGQTHLLRVAVPDATPTREDLQRRFEEAYFARFHVELPEIRANLVNVNTSVIGRRDEIDLSALIDASGRKATLDQARTGSRPVWFGRWIDTPVYWRDHLPLVATFVGPAIIEQMDTTILIEPGDVAQQDRDGNIIITIGSTA